jgi:hypothetical protein
VPLPKFMSCTYLWQKLISASSVNFAFFLLRIYKTIIDNNISIICIDWTYSLSNIEIVFSKKIILRFKHLPYYNQKHDPPRYISFLLCLSWKNNQEDAIYIYMQHLNHPCNCYQNDRLKVQYDTCQILISYGNQVKYNMNERGQLTFF